MKVFMNVQRSINCDTLFTIHLCLQYINIKTTEAEKEEILNS